MVKKMNEKLNERIISAAYGDAGIVERLKIYWIARHNEEAKSTLAEYRKIADRVHSIRGEEYPEASAIKTIQRIKREEANEKTFSIGWTSQLSKRPGVYAFGAILVVMAIAFALLREPKPNYEGYTEAQVKTADRQAKEALAIVGRVINRSRNTLKNDVLIKQIGLPIHESVQTVNQLFKEGNKHENIN